MKTNVRYIVVHSTQTLPNELHQTVPFHFIIYRNGKIVREKKLGKADACVQIAYLGGIDKDRKAADTKTDQQCETLFKALVMLSEKYPEAKIVGADEIFGNVNDPGFNVKEWLKNFVPKSINPAA
jgi:N-acetylmuramoyl-L-alanine amidase